MFLYLFFILCNVVEMLVREFEWDYVVCFFIYFLFCVTSWRCLSASLRETVLFLFFQYLFLFHTTAMWHVCLYRARSIFRVLLGVGFMENAFYL